MFKYSVKIRKVSGRLNESVLPQKNLVIKSKSRISQKKAFMMVEKYLKNKYGLSLHEAEIISEGLWDSVKKGFGKVKGLFGGKKNQQAQKQVELPQFPNSRVFIKPVGNTGEALRNEIGIERLTNYCKLRNKEFGNQRMSSMIFALEEIISQFLSSMREQFVYFTQVINSGNIKVATSRINTAFTIRKPEFSDEYQFNIIKNTAEDIPHFIDTNIEKIKNKGKSKQMIGDSLQMQEHRTVLQKFNEYKNQFITAITQKGFDQNIIELIKKRTDYITSVLQLCEQIQDVIYKVGENDRYAYKLMYAIDGWLRNDAL